MMTMVSEEQRKRIHPYKFSLWLGMASITMMFAGFTSAYIVKSNDSNWLQFKLPPVFWYSTFVILLSSLIMHLSLKAFRNRNIPRYKVLISVAVLLGFTFMALQVSGFNYLQRNGVAMLGSNSNPSASFIFVITVVHMAHVLGGIVVLLILLAKTFSRTSRTYSSVPLEVAGIYWHFVDAIWIYLFLFFNIVSG